MHSSVLNGQQSPATEAEVGPVAQLLVSPFGGASFEMTPAAEVDAPVARQHLASPFGEAMATNDMRAVAASEFEQLLAEFEDETFAESVQQLIDSSAARHLSSGAAWHSEAETPTLETSSLETWMLSLSNETDRLLERLTLHFGERGADSLGEGELETIGQQLLAEAGSLESETEQFLGGLLKKAGKIVKGVVKAAKKGIAAVSKFLPLGKLFGALRNLVKPLLQRVLKMAIGKLPAPVRPIAENLAKKLFGANSVNEVTTGEVTTGEQLLESFDAQLAEVMLAETPQEAEYLLESYEYEAQSTTATPDPIGALDAARTRLVRQLESATPGVSPVAELEQFLPVIMAALPLIKLGIGVIGRDRVVGFVADRLADLVKGHIGEPAAKAIARPIVSIGMGMIGLEAEQTQQSLSGGTTATTGLGTEAIVATVEDTVRQLMELPAEALTNDLRLEAEIQEAFVAATARHVPASLLQPGLGVIEAGSEPGVWVFMPRSTRPFYRYKKYSRVYRVPVSRPQARSVVFPNGDTLERRILDTGANVWPVMTEVHLYETVPGTQLGHLAAFESNESTNAPGVQTEQLADEYELFTPEMAASLLGEAGLGRRSAIGRGGAPTVRPGTRLVRIVAGGRRIRRRARFGLKVDVASASPTMQVDLRLSEREAHEMAGHLARRAHVQVVAGLKHILGAAFQRALTNRLNNTLAKPAAGEAAAATTGAATASNGANAAAAAGQAATSAGAASAGAAGSDVGAAIAEAMLSLLAKQLPSAAPALAQAAKDPKRGITLRFQFRFADKAALQSGKASESTLTIQPGWPRA